MATSISDLSDLDQFYHAYGRALAEWAGVEFRLCAWFELAAGLTIGRAEAIFFSGRSFQTRAEMLSASLQCGKLDESWSRFGEEALAKAISYNGFRNQIAHGQLEPETYHDCDDRWRLRKPSTWRHSGGVNREGLLNAAENFRMLTEVLSDGVWLQVHKHQPDVEFLQRLSALPSEAHSKSLSQKQIGRERQRQAALRSSKSSE